MSTNILRKIIASKIMEQAKNTSKILHNLNLVRYQGIQASKLVFAEYGEPEKVVKKESEELGCLKSQEVLVKMLAAPVNPADINTIQGTYPTKPKLPAVGGNEGVGEVVKIGDEVKDFELGDRVVPLKNALGTWRTYAVISQKELFKVPKDLGLVEAATFTVNPATAYRMLKDFVNLNRDDVIIQNGANSACGQYVIQLCKEWGIQTVNIIRDRPNLDELKSYLEKIGATYVLTEEELRKTEMFKTKCVKKPKLALNCVGGKSATELVRQLEQGGTIVTYGGMSREPVTVAISALIFKDVNVRGFWMTRWSQQNFDSPKRYEMFEEILDLMRAGKLKGPACEMISFDNFMEALKKTLHPNGKVGKKYILDFKS